MSPCCQETTPAKTTAQIAKEERNAHRKRLEAAVAALSRAYDFYADTKADSEDERLALRALVTAGATVREYATRAGVAVSKHADPLFVAPEHRPKTETTYGTRPSRGLGSLFETEFPASYPGGRRF